MCSWKFDFDGPKFHEKYLGRPHCELLTGLMGILRRTGDTDFIRATLGPVWEKIAAAGNVQPAPLLGSCAPRLEEYR